MHHIVRHKKAASLALRPFSLRQVERGICDIHIQMVLIEPSLLSKIQTRVKSAGAGASAECEEDVSTTAASETSEPSVMPNAFTQPIEPPAMKRLKTFGKRGI